MRNLSIIILAITVFRYLHRTTVLNCFLNCSPQTLPKLINSTRGNTFDQLHKTWLMAWMLPNHYSMIQNQIWNHFNLDVMTLEDWFSNWMDRKKRQLTLAISKMDTTATNCLTIILSPATVSSNCTITNECGTRDCDNMRRISSNTCRLWQISMYCIKSASKHFALLGENQQNVNFDRSHLVTMSFFMDTWKDIQTMVYICISFLT